MLREKKGFTLIELLIVIVIIGILAGIVVGIVGTSARRKANDTRKKADFHELQNALELYYQDQNSYPDNMTALVDDYEKTAIATLEANSGGKPYDYNPQPDTCTTAAKDCTSYTLTVELENPADTGANVIPGPPVSYQVESKQ